MALVKLNAKGLRCPQPVLKIAVMIPKLEKGDVLEVEADCATFEADVKKWCERMKKTLISAVSNAGVTVVQIHF
jgi:tRNA 2-thiouridine synthesizing protein A